MYHSLKSMQKSMNPVNIKREPFESANQRVSVYKPREHTAASHDNKEVVKTGISLWGRPFWFTLHHGALKLPDVLTEQDKMMIFNFITSMPIFIPCERCKAHAQQFINNIPHNFKQIIRTKENVFEFFWDFHNQVNVTTGKKTMTLEEAYKLYRETPYKAL